MGIKGYITINILSNVYVIKKKKILAKNKTLFYI